ncbi:hypothetical protein [Chitinimonas arctica]|uniref:hypothetical protein n=1 Tax=Chitinimonas arctica TaxID=2594795 RepID=UPI0015D35DA7|nr:hypothetical protein [Chitinimonas arctica]
MANNDRTLAWLHLNDRKIDDSSMGALVDALAQNTSLATLNLGYNQIGDRGAEALAGALERNTSLTTLGLSGSKVGFKVRTAIDASLVRNRQAAHTESKTEFQRAYQAAHAECKTLLQRVHLAAHTKSQSLYQSGQQFAVRGKCKLAEEHFREALRLSGKAKKRSLIQAALDQLVQRPTAVPRVSPQGEATRLESVSSNLPPRESISWPRSSFGRRHAWASMPRSEVSSKPRLTKLSKARWTMMRRWPRLICV